MYPNHRTRSHLSYLHGAGSEIFLISLKLSLPTDYTKYISPIYIILYCQYIAKAWGLIRPPPVDLILIHLLCTSKVAIKAQELVFSSGFLFCDKLTKLKLGFDVPTTLTRFFCNCSRIYVCTRCDSQVTHWLSYSVTLSQMTFTQLDLT